MIRCMCAVLGVKEPCIFFNPGHRARSSCLRASCSTGASTSLLGTPVGGCPTPASGVWKRVDALQLVLCARPDCHALFYLCRRRDYRAAILLMHLRRVDPWPRFTDRSAGLPQSVFTSSNSTILVAPVIGTMTPGDFTTNL